MESMRWPYSRAVLAQIFRANFSRNAFVPPLPPDIGRECAHRRRVYFGCTTVIVAGEDLPTPRNRGRYISSTSDGGTVYVPGVTARTR